VVVVLDEALAPPFTLLLPLAFADLVEAFFAPDFLVVEFGMVSKFYNLKLWNTIHVKEPILVLSLLFLKLYCFHSNGFGSFCFLYVSGNSSLHFIQEGNVANVSFYKFKIGLTLL
jgi:hypothetical protein